MPEKKQDVGIDDYYSHISAPKSDDSGEKKGLKLKIKAKRPNGEDAPALSESPATQTASAPAPSEKPTPVATQPERLEDKIAASFPKARVISREERPANAERPRPANTSQPRSEFRPRQEGGGQPRSDRPRYEGSNPRPNHSNQSNNQNHSNHQGNRPRTENRPNPNGQNGQNAPRDPSRPSYATRVREEADARRPKKTEVRISFETAKPITPIGHSAVRSGSEEIVTQGGSKNVGAGAGKLADYSARHRDDAKPGNNGGGGKKRPFDSSRSNDRNPAKKGALKTRGVSEDDGFRRSAKAQSSKKEKNLEDVKQILVDKTGQEIAIGDIHTVKEFSDKIGVPLPKVIAELMKNGMLVSINTKIDFDTCFLIGESFGVKIMREQNSNVSAASLLEGNVEELLKNDDRERRIPRPPIISIMGHVDHGKTSILDYIRNTTVASGEAGGITQKIGAYQVDRHGKKITFLDTPGHEAFSIMRSRGAKLTDLAVIVIAADEGMKPQTIESISHAREAKVPMIVAVNKMDKPGANLDMIRGQLAEQGLQPEEWGGDIVVVPVSAHTGLGIETLLDMIVLTTEMMELTADPTRSAIATVIESHLDPRLGPLSTILVNAGTLRKGDYAVCANVYGRMRALKDFRGKNSDEAGPSVPVQISGLSGVVEGGDILQVVASAEAAATKAHEYELLKSTKSVRNFEGASLDMLMSRIKTGSLKQLKIVLKCESNGSLEALKNALGKLSTEEIKVTFIHSGVGDVNDSDVLMAGTSQALLIAYNVSVNVHARSTLANSKIEFIDKKVIYHILEKVEAIITGMVDLRYDELELGEAVVKAIFYSSKDKLIVGLEIKKGKIENRAKIRVVRNDAKAGSWEVLNLKSGPSDVTEIEAGSECGISYKGDVKIQEGDRLEFYKMVARK